MAEMKGGTKKRAGGYSWLPPAFSQSYLGRAFRHAGCEVVFATVEADREVAWLAREHNAYALLSSDSDFFVFPFHDTLYLDIGSMKRRSSGSLSFVAYTPRDVANALELPVEALPLLAASLGFDVHQRSTWLSDLLKASGDAAAGDDQSAVDLAAAALRMRLAKHGLTPRSQREIDAVAWYQPAQPQQVEQVVTRPHAATLLRARKFVGSPCLEDLSTRLADGQLAGTAVYQATLPLRTAVYARLLSREEGTLVQERLCSARTDTEWPETVVDFGGVAAAPTPAHVVAQRGAHETPAAALARYVVTNWLEEHLTPAQARALIDQADVSARCLDSKFTLREMQPADAHAATLFLVAVDTFCWGGLGDETDPPVWELFHGPTFYTLLKPRATQTPVRAKAPLPLPLRIYESAARKQNVALPAAPSKRRAPSVRVDAAATGRRPPRIADVTLSTVRCRSFASIRY